MALPVSSTPPAIRLAGFIATPMTNSNKHIGVITNEIADGIA